MRLTTASTVALLFGTLPIFVALVSRAFGLEILSPRHWLAAAVSFGGVALVAAGAESGFVGNLGGVTLGLIASATWAAYSVAMGPLMTRYSPYRISAFVLIVGSIPLLITAAHQIITQDWADLSALAWACFIYSLFFSLVFTNIIWFTAIDRVGAARSSLYANLQPFLGAHLGAPDPVGDDDLHPGGRRRRDRRRDHPRARPEAAGREPRLTMLEP